MNQTDIHPKMYMYKRVVEAKCYIDSHYFENIDLEQISNQSKFSKYHFIRLFKNAFGQSPHQYLIDVRLAKAKTLLANNYSVKAACFEVGFESIPSFTTLFKKKTGRTPHAYVKQMEAQNIQKQSSPLSFIPNCFVESYSWNK